MTKAKQRESAETKPKRWSFTDYDPYKAFDSRKGCITAIGLCVVLIVVTALNALLNGVWVSLVFVPVYGLIIYNRLRRLGGKS